jgi:hypothetical protein
MRVALYAILLSATGSAHAPPPRAYFAHVTVTAPTAVPVRATWRPYAVSLGPDINEQQRRLRARARITHPDSLRRWRDTTARDTVHLVTPAEFTVDLAWGAVLLEALGPDSIEVATQLVPMGGRVAVERGRVFRLPRPPFLPPFGRRD